MKEAAIFRIRVDQPGESARAASELRLFRWAAECCQDGVIVTEQPTGSGWPKVIYTNPAFTLFSGLTVTDLQDQPVAGATTSTDDPLRKSLLESHQTDDVFEIDMVLQKENACRTVLHFRSEPFRDETGSVTHRIAIVRDITQQADLEDVARRNERLACIGLLVAGIAHEINNPTGAAMLAAETALSMMESPDAAPQVATCLRNIITSMDRCGRIVRTLLRYSREQPSEKQACSINDVAKQTLDLAQPYVEQRGGTLHLDLDPDVPLAPMNPLEIELVLINLVRNAVEAASGHAVVAIRTEQGESSVRVSVTDNGCGMNQEQLSHVFDPLYTTRRLTGGSGLGMTIAHGIVQGHDGRMEVQSQLGKGTTVTIDLPLVADARASDDKLGRSMDPNRRGRSAFC